MSNSTKTIGWPVCTHSNFKERMRTFDNLPPELRNTLNYYSLKICPICVPNLGEIAIWILEYYEPKGTFIGRTPDTKE